MNKLGVSLDDVTLKMNRILFFENVIRDTETVHAVFEYNNIIGYEVKSRTNYLSSSITIEIGIPVAGSACTVVLTTLNTIR